MKYLKELAFWLFIVILLGPWAIGFIDFASIFFTGSQLTGVPWVDGQSIWRIVVAVLWPIVILMVAVVFVG